jgi:Caspase domain
MFRGAFFAAAISVSLLTLTEVPQAEEQKLQNFQKIYEDTVTAARDECTRLWSNPAFDSLRKKIPLGDEKPTFAMLKNPEKLKQRDKSIADLAIQTVEKCRKTWEPVYEMIPPDAKQRILNGQRLQDAKITELYNGKITFGEFNVALSELIVDAAGLSRSSKPETDHKATSAAEKQRLLSIPAREKFASGARVALIIGNSNYTNLPKLTNPANDAKAVADLLGKMGYASRLLLDSSEQNTRREIRQFASDSEHAEAAVVYYAGHGAQVNGSNYLLPIDADVPRTEVDIQFSALKVDDLINSIQSNTKIIFLDACRDNPAIYKNLARGRGSAPLGLAPAASSHFEQRMGGGLFIAYATDAGAVADDGNGKHSPFTDALLRNIEKPISIDDMFSLVTKEVRLVTKNLQRPYKYASLENIFCLSPSCGAGSANPIVANSSNSNPVAQAQQSETDELNVAKSTKKIAALENFLAKYPDAPDRKEVEDFIKSLKLSEYSEWTFYELGDKRLPYYVQLSSLQQLKGKSALGIKFLIDPNSDKTFFGKQYPDAKYVEEIAVYDCQSPRSALADATVLSDAGTVLYHYKWADPQYLDLGIGTIISAGSVASSLQRLACSEEAHSPLVTKGQLAKMKFKSLASTASGDGELFYELLSQQKRDDQTERQVMLVFRFYEDKSVSIEPTALLERPLKYRMEVNKVNLKCAEKKFS